MKTKHKEPARINPSCELRLGIASWDDGSNSNRSVKFAWLSKDGKVSRGGKFPVEALLQALDFAIRKGYISLDSRQ